MKAELGKVFILGYRQYSGEGIKQGIDVQNEIGRLKDELALVANPYGVSAEYSVGVGRWSSVPWIRLYYQENSPSAQKGVYIVYLFSAKEDAVYLALSQGTAKSNDVDLNVIKKRIQENVEPQDFLLGSESLDLGDKKSYGKAVVFYKKYERMSIPEDKELKEDAERMLSIYEECKSKHLLSVNESVDDSEKKNLSSLVMDNQVENSGDEKKTSEKKVVLRLNQKIFFGAPGTGKSFKVNQLVGDTKNVFRTTFHPDYDYAQFVGSYKPVSLKTSNLILSKDALAEKAKSFDGGDFPLYKFSAQYAESLEDMNIQEKMSVVKDSPLGIKKDGNEKDQATFSIEMNTGVSVGKFLKKELDLSSVSYLFVPQVFANAYAAAWKNLSQPVYLVIEEINRGNCAQIFGDLFQLLDRDENGCSSYEIDADADFADWIEKQLDSSAAPQNDIPEEIRSGRKLRLPPNFNILATMNTSDQSLFPMDSAFKRRFDWEYVPIDFEGKDCADYQIEVGGEKPYPWQKFVESVNEKIVSITDSEDKQLGEYFIKLNPVDNNVITKERFLGKVMFYLWNEVCKDVHKQESFFREEENGNYFTFQDLYKKDGDKKLISFMDWITK